MERITRAIEEIKAGKMIIVVDNEDRENEGDLIMAADCATPEAINFMARYGRGLICVPMQAEELHRLGIGPMVVENTDPNQTAFTVSVDEITTTTGISAHERATTIKRLATPGVRAEAFRQPGHIFPLAARAGGVLKRPGHTEAAVDLARLAGCVPAGVICEILKEDGTMARRGDLDVFAKEHDLMVITIEELIAWRLKNDPIIRREATTVLPTRYGNFTMVAFENKDSGEHHVALTMGSVSGEEPILVRMHSECLTGDVFGSLRCDCGEQLDRALKAIAEEGKGALIYLRQEGRGIGLVNKIKAYALQDEGLDTVEANLALGLDADSRDYGVGAAILHHLGIKRIKLMTNNPTKIEGLSGYDLEIVERVPIEPEIIPQNQRYLEVKREKMGHLY